MKWHIFTLLALGLVISGSRISYAAETANTATIRFDSNIAGQSPGKTLIIYETPSVSDAEAYIAVTLDAAWQPGSHFSPLAGNYVTSTLDIPSGTTALPLSSASAVSVVDRTIYFAITDLSPGVQYAFYIMSTPAGFIQNPNLVQNMLHTISTTNSSLQLLSTGVVSSPIITSNTVTIQASVLPQPSDLSIELAQLPVVTSPLSQNQVLEYEVTYSSQLNYPLSAQIEVEWTLGTVSGSLVPTVPIVQYVTGSASTPTGGSAPVIDLANRRILWTVVIPASATDEKIYFSLITTSAYTGSNTVSFTTRSSFSMPIQTAYSEIAKQYQYQAPPATPSPTSVPSSPGKSPTSTPSTPSVSRWPTSSVVLPLPPGLSQTRSPLFRSVRIQSISDNQVTLLVETLQSGSVRARFGSEVGRLISQSNSSTGTFHQLTLTNLEPGTNYYAMLSLALDGSAPVDHSELLVVRSASRELLGEIEVDSLTVKHFGFPLLKSGRAGVLSHPVVVVPISTQYEVSLLASSQLAGSSLELVVDDGRVLGFSTQWAVRPAYASPAVMGKLLMLSDQTYYGLYRSPAAAGRYEAKLIISDQFGNLRNVSLFTLVVVEPLTVRSESGEPISDAEVFILRKNSTTSIFEPIDQVEWGIQNPQYTNRLGQVLVALPPGEYKVVVAAFEYHSSEHIFALLPQVNAEYPLIVLANGAFSWMGLLEDYAKTLGDIGSMFHAVFSSLASSSRVFRVIMHGTFAAALLLSLGVVSTRLGSSLLGLPVAIISLLSRWRHAGKWRLGRVIDDDTQHGIVGAEVLVVNAQTQAVVQKLKTNSAGFFYFIPPQDNAATVFKVHKKTYAELISSTYTARSLGADQTVALAMTVDPSHTHHIVAAMGKAIFEILSVGLELYLVLVLVLLVFYTQAMGLSDTWLLWVLSLITLTLLLIERWQLKAIKRTHS